MKNLQISELESLVKSLYISKAIKSETLTNINCFIIYDL